MPKLAHADVLFLLIQISVLLITARIFGEAARRFRQPTVIGELFAGIFIGPTLIGGLFPSFIDWLFKTHKNAYIAYDGLTSVSMVFLMFVAGMEVEFENILKRGKVSIIITATGTLIPFILGFGIGWIAHPYLDLSTDQLLFAMFSGTALSISALPVIAKILLDLSLIKTDLGSIIIASATLSDIIGWLLLSVILSNIGTTHHQYSIAFTLLMTVLFTVITLTAGRWIINKLLPLFKQNFAGQGGIITFALCTCFAGAAFTEYIGIHALFGAFIVGIAFGDSFYFSEKSREIVYQFVTNIFAPLFFASVGLRVNFIANFDLSIVLAILSVAFLAKFLGSFVGGYISGLRSYQALVVGAGLNARGAMEIILGLIALEYKIIDEKVFVGLVIMALITSMTSGGLMKYFLKKEKKKNKVFSKAEDNIQDKVPSNA
ncbi:MAG: cation:proton antiporter [Bacteroidia bacterium]|nr:cation:proton antiporter [Bacteroidia bacterium]MDW8348514.1 cation:proton antiporter [Bacteroidia bacterium]